MSDPDSRFLDGEYASNVAELSDLYDVPETAVEERYVDYCQEIQRRMKDGMPLQVLRRLAFNQTESALADADGLPQE